MQLLSRLEHDSRLDKAVSAGQRAAWLIRPGKVRDGPHVAGAADWSEQHEQQMRVGVVHAAANVVAMSLYGASLLARGPRLGPALRLAGAGVGRRERAGRWSWVAGRDLSRGGRHGHRKAEGSRPA
jgi:hypothetical protein